MNTGFVLYRTVNLFFTIYYYLILANVIFSWIRPMRGSWLYELSRVVSQLTEPLLSPIRRALPMMGGLDFSPFIALVLLNIVQRLVTGLLF